MSVLSFIAMYAIVDRRGYVYSNINQGYMAALMTAPMIIIEIILMRGMYQDTKLNAAIIIGSAILLAGSFLLIRLQTSVGDTQFVRSTIPHHSGAIR